MSYFFFLFYRKVMKVLCTLLIILIEYLEVCWGNVNLLSGKHVILFKSLAQKKETKKQTVNVLYFKY